MVLSALRPALAALFLAVALASAQDPALGGVRRLLDAGRADVARRRLEALRPRLENDAVWRRLALEAARGAGDHEAVLALGEPFSREHPADREVEAWIGESLLALGAGEGLEEARAAAFREQALETAQRLLAGDPADGAALALRARALLALGHGDQALEGARAAARDAPGETDRRLLLTEVLEARGEVGEAVAELHRAARELPGRAAMPLARAGVHQRAGQREEAIRALVEAAAAAPHTGGDARVFGELVWLVFGRHRDFEGAWPVLAAWRAAHPRDPRAAWWEGYLRELAGEDAPAEAAYRAALELGGGRFGDAALHLAHRARARGAVDEAARLYGIALAEGARPREGTVAAADGLLALLEPLFRAGRLAETASMLEKQGVANDPDDWRLQQNLGFVLRELGAADHAKKMLTRAQGRWKKAAEHYVAASGIILLTAATDEQKAQVLNDTGLMFHYHLGRIDEGIRWYRRALEHDPGYLDALENLGVAHLGKKDPEEAIRWFDRVLALAPDRAVAKAERARAAALLEAARKR